MTAYMGTEQSLKGFSSTVCNLKKLLIRELFEEFDAEMCDFEIFFLVSGVLGI